MRAGSSPLPRVPGPHCVAPLQPCRRAVRLPGHGHPDGLSQVEHWGKAGGAFQGPGDGVLGTGSWGRGLTKGSGRLMRLPYNGRHDTTGWQLRQWARRHEPPTVPPFPLAAALPCSEVVLRGARTPDC